MDWKKYGFDEVYVVGPGSDYGNAMWSDIDKLSNGHEFDYAIASDNKILRLLHHIHFSFTLNKKIDLPFQKIWKRSYALESIRFSDNKQYFVLLPDVSACRIDKSYLNYLQSKKNICLVLFIVNIMQRKTRLVLDRVGYFDYVFTFSKIDADNYGFIYHDSVYSKQKTNKKIIVKNDAFFAGAYSEKRLELLREIVKKMQDNGLNSKFHINGVQKSFMRKDGIVYNHPLSYREVLYNTIASNCIIEILGAESDCGFTMRTAEALCYNKKLITNNSSIRFSKYYDPNKILIFNSINDIAIDFIEDRTAIDYGYKGDYSPLRLIEEDCFEKWKKQKNV